MPRRAYLKHLKGLRVRVKRDMETKGGSRFPKGSICRITYADTAYLTLAMRNPDPLNILGPRNLGITNVRRWDIEWLTPDRMEPPAPEKKPKRPRRAPEVAPEKEEPEPLVDEDDIQSALNDLESDSEDD